MNYEINDIRKITDFKGICFSKYQKTKVKKELINCLISNKVEPACYWCAELICAGHFSDVWDIIILYITKYIHIGNPKIPIYIAKRFESFKEILINGYIDNELSLRNNNKIRKIFAEIMCVLCFSRKKNSIEGIKINKKEEFDMINISSKLEASSIEYGNLVFKKEDPKELFIAINELSYHLSKKSKNIYSACYWLEWIIEYEYVCKKNKDKCICERRTFAPVLEKYQMDSIWIVWDIILYETEKKKNKLLTEIIHSLLNIFSIKYTQSVKKRRKFVIYFAISLLIEKFDIDTKMITNLSEINKIVSKIHIVYKDVKKNEISPNTDYLLVNERKSNLDKTIERIEKLNNINKKISNANNSENVKINNYENDFDI